MIGQVFEAEKQVAKTGVIHKYCLACNDCHCNLDASSFYNGADGEVIVNFKIQIHTFHKNIYARAYNPEIFIISFVRYIANIVTQKDSDINKSQTTRDGWMLRLSKEKKMISLHVQDATEKFLRLNEWSHGLEAFISHVLVALSVTRNWILLQSVKVIDILEKWENISIKYPYLLSINV